MHREISRVSIIKAVEDPSLLDESDDIDEQPKKTTSDYSLCENNSTIQLKPSSLAPCSINDNFIVIWLHLDGTYSDRDLDQESSRLQCAAQATKTFTDADDCIDFLTNLTDQDAFVILSGPHIQPLVFIINNIPELQGIYILDKQKIFSKDDFQQCRKLRGIFNDMEYLSNALNQHIHRLTISSMPFSIVSTSSSPNLGQLDQSFIYTQLIRELVLEIEYDSNAKDRFVQYYLDQYKDDAAQSRLLRGFKQSYKSDDAIQWYARETFLYSWLNKALRLQDTKTIIRMAFYLRDLHQQIAKRCAQTKRSAKLTVYRGQQMSINDFEKLKKSVNQVLSFNGFLSTSLSRDVAKFFAADTSGDADSMNVLFRMEIDPLASYSPFVFINELDSSNQSEEQEVLFCMQTIFRIGEMKEIHEHLWEIDLTVINDSDLELQNLANFLKRRWEGMDSWYRMVDLMVCMGKYEEAMEIFNTLSETSRKKNPDMISRALISLVTIAAQKSGSKEFQSCALLQLEEFVKDWENKVSPDQFILAFIYLHISLIHRSSGNYDEAFKYAEKILNNPELSELPGELMLALAHENISALYNFTRNYQEALIHLQKALELRQKSYPHDEPYLSVIYNMFAIIHGHMNDRTKAISYLEEALKIQWKYLPPDHIFFSISYSTLGQQHHYINNNKEALSCYKKALEICQINGLTNDSDYASICGRISIVYQSMNEYENSLPYLKKALVIYQDFSNSDGLNSEETCMNLAHTLRLMRDYESSLLYSKKALELKQQALDPTHPGLIPYYYMIGRLHYSMGEYEATLEFFDKVLQICEQSYAPDHPEIGKIYNDFASVHRSMGNYDKSREYVEMAFKIQQKTLSFDDPTLGTAHFNAAFLNILRGDPRSAVNENQRAYDNKLEFLSVTTPSINSHGPTEARHQQLRDVLTATSRLSNFFTNQQSLDASNRVQSAMETLPTVSADFERICQSQLRSCVTNEISSGNSSNTINENEQMIRHTLNALSPLNQILQAFQTNLMIDHTDTDDDDLMCDPAAFMQKNLTQTISGLKNAFEVYQRSLPPNDPSFATVCNLLGSKFSDIRCYPEALSNFEQALQITRHCLPSNHPLLAEIHNNMANALYNVERYEEAIEHAEQAVNIAHVSLGPENSKTKAYVDQLCRIQQKIQR